jgi:ankyrin repeat protein
MEPFTEENEVEFLNKVLFPNGNLTEPENERKEVEEVRNKPETFSKEISQECQGREITEKTLSTCSSAKVFDGKYKPYPQSVEPATFSPTNEPSLGLYKGFVDRKYERYRENRTGKRVSSDAAKSKDENILECAREDHQRLALKVRIGEEQLTHLQIESDFTLSKQLLAKIGIAEVNGESELQFIHWSFADYFVADFLVSQLTSGAHDSLNVQDFLLSNIFLEPGYKLIRHFIDELLSKSKPSMEILKQYGNGIKETRECFERTFYQAACEGNANIIGFSLESLEVGGHRDTISELLLAQDNDKHTAWFLAAWWGEIIVLEKLWNWAVKKLTTKVLKDKLLLAKDSDGYTVWNIAANTGNTEVLQKIWEFAKEVLTPQELKCNLFFDKDEREKTLLHTAAEKGEIKVLQRLWELAKGELTAKDIKNNLFLVEDLCGLNAWLYHTEVSHKQMSEKIKEVCDWAKQELMPENLSDHCMLAKDIDGKNAWHIATEKGNIQLLEAMWDWANWLEVLPSKLLLAKDKNKQTAFHIAADQSCAEVLQKLWDWAKETLTEKNLQNELLLAKPLSELTAWHNATGFSNIEIIQKIWEWAKEKLVPEDLTNEMLLATNVDQQNVLHLAVRRGDIKVLEEIWKQCEEKLTQVDIKNKLLLAKDAFENTIWHMAVYVDKIEILQKIWKWAKEKPETEEEIQATEEEKPATEEENNLLLATDYKGRTGWHIAAKKGNIKILQQIWDWAKEQLEEKDLKHFFLLAKDNKEKTAWHAAARFGNIDVFNKLCKWAQSILSENELRNILFVAEDHKGRTVENLAEITENSQLILKVAECVKKQVKINKQRGIKSQRKPVANRR